MDNEKTNNEDMKIEDLALMMQKGFIELGSKLETNIQEVKTELKSDISKGAYTMDTKFDEVTSKLSKIEVRLSGVEESLKDEVIHREEFNDLTSRVKYTELKLGVQSGK